MVDCTALEMRHRCKPIGGSNPPLSATLRPVGLRVAGNPSSVGEGALPSEAPKERRETCIHVMGFSFFLERPRGLQVAGHPFEEAKGVSRSSEGA